MTSQQLLLAQRVKGVASSGAPVSQDVGNVGVVVDNGKIFVQPKPGSPFDLMTPTNIEWTRTAAEAGWISETGLDGWYAHSRNRRFFSSLSFYVAVGTVV